MSSIRIIRISLKLWQPCTARFKDLTSYETALRCGSLVLQRCKDLLSFSYGPTFMVLVMLRIECFGFFHYQRATQLVGQGTRNKASQKRGLGITRGPIKGKRHIRTTRKQKYAAILQTLHATIFKNFVKL